jgi:hypothetical protein
MWCHVGSQEAGNIILGRQMTDDASTEHDPKVKFELEAETGEILEVCFSLTARVLIPSLAVLEKVICIL